MARRVGVLERRQYQAHPPRDEYVLTARDELVDLLMVMVAWGDRWAGDGAGPPVFYRHRACDEISHVELHCACCGPMGADDVELLDGPGADI